MLIRYILLGFAVGFWVVLGVAWWTGLINEKFDIALALLTDLMLIGLYVGTGKD